MTNSATLDGIITLYKREREDYMWLEQAHWLDNHEQFYYFLSLINDGDFE